MTNPIQRAGKMKTKTGLRPLLKWPGGKYSEYQYIEGMIPDYDRYVEPFAGGAAVFLQELPDIAALNDISKDLTSLYRHLQGDRKRNELQSELEKIAQVWDKYGHQTSDVNQLLTDLYKQYAAGAVTRDELDIKAEQIIDSAVGEMNSLAPEAIVSDRGAYGHMVKENVVRKIQRTSTIEANSGTRFDSDMVARNIETALRSALYMHMRAEKNRMTAQGARTARDVAIWLFVREYCYGSMFRYSARSGFNVPYGGMGYNGKKFSRKVDYLLSHAVQDAFSKAEIHNLDFEEFLELLQLNANDFVFLDPPYHTEFSSYGGHDFDEKDHKRLANFISSTPASCLMIIKSTPFIERLYGGLSDVSVERFDKMYAYNVKGRNVRSAEHIIVRNYRAFNSSLSPANSKASVSLRKDARDD